jgi:hypothetical protein
MNQRQKLVLASLGMALGACGGIDSGDVDSEPVAGAREAITAGSFVGGNDGPESGAVRLGSRLAAPSRVGNMFCSGVKIGPRRFVTAASCANGLFASTGGARLLITNEPCQPPNPSSQCSFATGQPEIRVDRSYIHPSFLGAVGRASDVMVIDVLSDTPPLAATLDTAKFEGGEGATLIAYGCPSEGRRQFGNFTALSQAELTSMYPLTVFFPSASALSAADALFVFADGVPRGPGFPPSTPAVQGCNGDFGGPLFTAGDGGTMPVTGIASFAAGGSNFSPLPVLTAFTRVAPVASWLRAPTIKGRPGSITNALSGACLGVGGSTASGAAVRLEFCDGREGTRDTQYWTVSSSSAAPGTSLIRNGKSNLCLASRGSGDAAVVQLPCRDESAQEWMVAPGVGPARSQITNRSSAVPLGYRNAFPTSSRIDQTLPDGSNRQYWILTRP